MPRPGRPCHPERVRGRLFVLGQLVLFVALGLGPVSAQEWDVPVAATVTGGVLLVAGLAVASVALLHLGEAVTPLPEPRPGAELVATGLYRWVRHPVYSGVLLTAVGWTLVFPSEWTAVVTVALLLLLTAKSGYEERLLRTRYAGYADYARRTPRFVPRPGRRSAS